MIQELWIKDVATYDEAGIQIVNLKKINFIYGANACGKTTITKFTEAPSDPLYSKCSMKWKNDLPVKVLVYNKDFRERNFGKGSMAGVFTLGQATREQIAEIAKMQGELQAIIDDNTEKKLTYDKYAKDKLALEEEFRETVWAGIYKKHELDFKESFRGVMNTKPAFMAKLLDEFKNNPEDVKTFDELKTRALTVFGKIPVSMPLVPQLNFSRLTEIESDPIWKKKIIGKSDVEIARLIQKLNLNDWVNEGRDYLQDDEICPFCQQETISKEFRKQLEDYFDETFVNDTSLVKSLSDEYLLLTDNISSLLQQIEANEKRNTGTKLNIELFSALIKTNTTQFFSGKGSLTAKIKEPSRAIELVSTTIQLQSIQELITKTNSTIRLHNDIINNYPEEKRKLIRQIWRFLVEENKIIIKEHILKAGDLQKALDGLLKQHQDLNLKHKELKLKIQHANRNVTSVQPSVDQINKTLQSYGFLNFELVPSPEYKNQYLIHREDGSLAESTLSEGEITFITFLYFLQLAKGSVARETISEERVLIVDDPISSLDSNILSVISSLMKEIIKEISKNKGPIRQLIILTHNVYFHKEVSFLDRKSQDSKDRAFWILRRSNKISTIQSYGAINPIKSSYELLWNELNAQKDFPGIGTQNIMRRIIENYFKMMGTYGDDDLINKFEDPQEQEICRSLISWIHDGSHSLPDDLFIEHPDSIVAKYSEVFKKIFDRMGHLPHYNMMMRVEIVENNIV